MDIAKQKRKWLWQVGRVMGLLPISFKNCVCPSQPAFLSSRGSDRLGDPGLPPSWDATGRIGGVKECSCPVAARSVPWMMYSCGVAAVLLPMSMYAVYSDRAEARAGRPSLRMSTRTDELVTFCDILSNSFCTLVCFLQLAYQMQKGSLFSLLDQMQQVDRLLQIRPPAVPGLLALWLLLLILIMFMDASMWTEMNQGLQYAATYLPFYGVYLNTFVMEVLFIDEAHSINMRFKALNQMLDAALALPSYQVAVAAEQPTPMTMEQGWMRSSARSRRMSIAALADGTLYPSKLGTAAAAAAGAGSRRSRMRPEPGGGAAAGALVPIQRLNMAHHMLCELTFTIARRYGLSLLADMLCLLLHLVITAYFLLKHLISETVLVSGQYIVMQAVWLAAHLGRMLFIVLPCSRASAEAGRTGTLVGVVLSTTAPSSHAHRQLETFSIQLLHHRVNFNACGLFELGLPLVVSILGAVTTYLVVLLQLKGAPGESTANSTAVVS
ncbi:gustatory receptor for sugar taste 43a-like isoform X2 [Frankliniella occidentalis]|uniref:Gustatory receptor n=1 Tax=Frankliniella occidentalis TaxID=133901 RepID=A0A9C6X838_FRAOC|nr:gustatory receptor for sugar taste 43a-like isoform X2 [Frankliniella occidentalis]